MKQYIVIFLLFISFNVGAEELISKNIQTPVYIDVRTWVEHKVNHIDGDPRIHISEIVDGVQNQFPDKSTPIRLYCAAGVRAGRGVERLKAAGYTNVENVGGIENVKKIRFGDEKAHQTAK